MKKINLILIAFSLLLACNYSSENKDYTNDEIRQEPSGEGYETEGLSKEYKPDSKSEFKTDGAPNNNIKMPNQPNFHNRKMIWTGNLKFQVENVNNSTNKISEIVADKGGFMSNLNLTSTNYQISNNITIRIENNKFHDLIGSLKGESVHIDKEEIKSNDVTAEFVDIESRLKTKKEVRDRYITILRTKTGKIKDIIAAEEAIRQITEEIEVKEGRLRYLKDKVNFSSIHLTIYQKVDYKDEPVIYEKPYSSKIGKSFLNGWKFIQGFFLVLVSIWPLLLILGGVIFWKRKWIFRERK